MPVLPTLTVSSFFRKERILATISSVPPEQTVADTCRYADCARRFSSHPRENSAASRRGGGPQSRSCFECKMRHKKMVVLAPERKDNRPREADNREDNSGFRVKWHQKQTWQAEKACFRGVFLLPDGFPQLFDCRVSSGWHLCALSRRLPLVITQFSGGNSTPLFLLIQLG